MTLEEAKDRAAYLLYSKIFSEVENTDAIDHKLRIMEKAAELYARAKWDECNEKNREELAFLFANAGGTLSAYFTFKNLPKPEFKP